MTLIYWQLPIFGFSTLSTTFLFCEVTFVCQLIEKYLLNAKYSELTHSKSDSAYVNFTKCHMFCFCQYLVCVNLSTYCKMLVQTCVTLTFSYSKHWQLSLQIFNSFQDLFIVTSIFNLSTLSKTFLFCPVCVSIVRKVSVKF